MNPLIQLVIALDQLANVLLLGWADETLSARAWRTEQNGRLFGKLFRPCIDLLFFWQREHCFQAFIEERRRLQVPPSYRD